MAWLLLAPAAWGSDAPVVADATFNSDNTSLLRFDLSGLPAGLTGLSITKATLQVFVNRVGTAGTMQVAPLVSDWSESSGAHSAIPAIGTPIGAGVAVSQAGEYVTYDVTSAVQAWINAPGSNFGLALSSSGLFYLDSKENTSTSHAATLDVTLAVAPAGEIFVQDKLGLNVAAGPYSMPVETSFYNTAFGAETLSSRPQGRTIPRSVFKLFRIRLPAP